MSTLLKGRHSSEANLRSLKRKGQWLFLVLSDWFSRETGFFFFRVVFMKFMLLFIFYHFDY